MKKFISILLLLTLSIQMIPVKQIGSLLYSNTVNEDIPADSAKSFNKNETVADLFTLPPLFTIAENSSFEYLHSSVAIPRNFSADVQTPPPNQV